MMRKQNLKIGIIGSGCSGIFLATLLCQKNEKYDITIIDRNTTNGKKFLVTGNGRCNFGNKNINEYSYNNKKTYDFMSNFSLNSYIKFLNKTGIETRYLNNLLYPYDLSSKNVQQRFLNYLKDKVKFINNEIFLDYKKEGNQIRVKTNNNFYKFDKLVFATGGLSSLNYENNIFSILKEHNYEIKKLKPGLAPLILKENVSSLVNLREKCIVNLAINNKIFYKEEGEVLFKKDGISGICIMNISSLINRENNFSKDYDYIFLDLAPEFNEDELFIKLKKYYSDIGDKFLNSFFDYRLADYILKDTNKNLDTDKYIKLICDKIKNLKFHMGNTYDFNNSQVTIGGISYLNLNDNLMSNIEKEIYFIGEILDGDGLCGGYNLMFDYQTALIVSQSF